MNEKPHCVVGSDDVSSAWQCQSVLLKHRIIGWLNSDGSTSCSTLSKDKPLSVWVIPAFHNLITGLTILPGFSVLFSLSLVFSFQQLTIMFLSVISLYLSYLGFSDLLESVG